MVKLISGAMDAHLAGAVTTLATCWKITRTDGVILGYTDHDGSMTISGVQYKAATGFYRTAITTSAASSVDNLDVQGFLDDASIKEVELRNGAFDYAQIEIFAVNWADLTQGIIKLRFGYFGEVLIVSSGFFKVELRGLTQLFSQTIGEVYSPECRADLGDSRCTVQLTPDTRESLADYALNQRVLVPNTSGQNYRLPLVEPGFEATGGWVYSGDASRSGPNLWISPYAGNFHLKHTMAPGADIGTYQIVDLTTLAGLNTALIDSGGFEIQTKCRWGGETVGVKLVLSFQFYSGTDGSTGPLSTVRSNDYVMNGHGFWETGSYTVAVPATTRSVRVYLRSINYTSNARANAVFDEVVTRLYEPSYSAQANHLGYGGIEFICTTAGKTAAAAPTYTYSIGDVITDGTAVFTGIMPTHMFTSKLITVISNSVFTVESFINQPDDWFQWGVIEFLSGNNLKRKMEIKAWDNATKQITLVLPVAYTPLVNDALRFHTGCAKSRTVCVTKFDNILNYRGEPDLPGTDKFFKVGGANTSASTSIGGGGK